MKPLSETELKAIHDRCEAATPGPWKTIEGQEFTTDILTEKGESIGCADTFSELADGRNQDGVSNARFIAYARTDIPALLDEIARLKALTQWQPIETAPKKLGPVLIEGGMKHEIHRCYGPVPLIGVVEAYYYPSTAYPDYDYEATDDTDTVRYAPTHWMPLPEPPEVTP